MMAAMTVIQQLRNWARRLKRDGLSLWFAGRHPGTPWHAKALAALIVAYALSPIDLIPDFIPVLGYLDDLLLLPILIHFGLRLLPPEVLADCRRLAEDWLRQEKRKPVSWLGAALVLLVWLAATVAIWFALRR